MSQCVLFLAGTRADDGDPEAHGLRELDRNVAQSAQPNHAEVQPWLVEAIVSQGAVGCDPYAEERGHSRKRQVVGNRHCEVLIHHHDVGEAAAGGGPVTVLAVESADHLLAVVLEISSAVPA